jgi:hypothetical protein
MKRDELDEPFTPEEEEMLPIDERGSTCGG